VLTARAGRLALVLTVLAGLCVLEAPTGRAAGPSPSPSPSASPSPAPRGDPDSEVDAARKKLAEAQQQAAAARDIAAADQRELLSAQTRLAALQDRVVALDAEVARDQAQVGRLQLQIARDKAQLAGFIRGSYESGGATALVAYVFSAASISIAMQRSAEVSSITGAGERLLDRITAEEQQAQQALAGATTAKAAADAARAQMATQAAIIADATAQAQIDAANAAGTAAQIQQQLKVAVKAAAAYDAAAQQLATARAEGTIFAAVGGPLFTVDSDLTKPSGETAATLNAFLNGTALAGLGDAFMAAESKYHVSARYLVAHAIEESSWGTSDIARDKHNLFGYGAHDSNPYGDANSFPTFTGCIDFVAQRISQDYLSPKGRYYHGPTLHGMNVNYASDPYWSQKIARIARSIPMPDGSH